MMEKNIYSMSLKQIRGALGLKKSATVKIKAELQKLIKEGKILNDGSPYDIINSKILSDLFNISIKVIEQAGYWRMVPLNN